MMSLRSENVGAAFSSSQGRGSGLPPRPLGPVIRETQNEGTSDPVEDQQDGAANIQIPPDVYA
ncbi:hypothetical protein Drorol1_Dr00026646 [Drosera rotundifolia]